jgi:C-terminal processing protease CtpA/Prc
VNFLNPNTLTASTSIGNDIFESKKIEEAKTLIRSQYYHFSEKTKEEIENAFIEALVASLGDKHSTYFPPKEANEFTDTLR